MCRDMTWLNILKKQDGAKISETFENTILSSGLHIVSLFMKYSKSEQKSLTN